MPRAGDRLILDKVEMDVLWPTVGRLDFWKASSPKELNESSIVLRLGYGGFCVYLTGDLPKEILQGLIDQSCQVLKISHHGSKTGTNQGIIESASPAVAIIQVGKNSFGHPHKEVVDLLVSKGVKILRNDINGIIEVDSDGKSFWAKSEK